MIFKVDDPKTIKIVSALITLLLVTMTALYLEQKTNYIFLCENYCTDVYDAPFSSNGVRCTCYNIENSTKDFKNTDLGDIAFNISDWEK